MLSLAGPQRRLLAALAVCGALAAGASLRADSPSAPPPPPAAPAPQKPADPIVFDFQSGLCGWTAGADGATVTLADGGKWRRKGRVAELQSKDGSSATLRLKQRMDLSGFRSLKFDVLLPETPGQNIQVAAYFVDSDDLWYQSWRPITPQPGGWAAVEVNLLPEAAALEPVGHARPWGPYAARSVREIGLRVFADRPLSGRILLDKIVLKPRLDGLRRQEIFNYETSGDEVGQFKKFEITFELSRSYSNPYDPAQVEIRGLFTSPTGKLTTVPGFFYQDYERRIDRKVEHLTPAGSPKWKVRFAPHEMGKWSFQVQVSDGDPRWQGTDTTLTTPRREFRCVRANDPGFVRVSAADARCFEFEDGSFFYQIGHNIPATFNLRAAEALGTTPAPYEGTGAYDRYLDGMVRGEENFARIWLSSWSFGLEWRKPREDPAAPKGDASRYAYDGLGRYNQENAWRLDYVMERAENLGIYVQLALTTFGAYRLSGDDLKQGDWDDSPYNRINGGPLARPQEFWTHEPSQQMYQRMVRYVMARWGYSSHVAAWELCNELDLVSGYPYNFRPDRGHVSMESLVAWHKRCAETIRKYDPNPHLITTNFWEKGTGEEILRLPEISFTNWHDYNADIVGAMRKIFQDKTEFGKPTVMTECGLAVFGASQALTKRYLHIGLWSSYMIPFAGAGMYWWWDFLDDQNLYSMFRPLAEFAKGEDRRNPALHTTDGELKQRSGAPEPEVAVIALQDARSGYFWVYERGLLRPESAGAYIPQRREGMSLELKGFDAGSYRVEFWDTSRGERVQEATVQAKDGVLACAVPAFMNDIAGKIKPAKVQAASARPN